MASDTAQTTYDAKIEDIGPAAKRITITVPASVVDEKLRDSMGTLAASASVPGFRKGKAPAALLERRFGESVRGETRNQVVSESYAAVLEEHKLEPVTEPRLVEEADELVIETGKPLTFSLEIEVVPEFEVPDTDGMAINRPVVEVTEELISKEIERQCRLAGDIIEVSEDFTDGDRLIGPGSVLKEGDTEPFFQHDQIDILIPAEDDGGKGQVLGLVIEGLRDRAMKAAIGDLFTIEATGPDGHELEHIRGRKLTISVQIRQGLRLIPATVESLVERFGFESVEMLREQVRMAVEQRIATEQQAAMREQAGEKLDEMIPIELPERLTEAQASRMLERARLEMLHKGLPAEEIETRLAEHRSDALEQSQRRLKRMFILHRLARHFQIDVSEQEVNGYIHHIAMSRNERPDKIRQELVQSGGINQVAMQVRDHKTLDRIVTKAVITDLSADDWNASLEEKKKNSRKNKKAPAKKAT